MVGIDTSAWQPHAKRSAAAGSIHKWIPEKGKNSTEGKAIYIKIKLLPLNSQAKQWFPSKSFCLVCSPESDLSFFLPGRKGKINWRIYAIYASTFSYWKMNLNLNYDSNFLNLGSGWRSQTNRKCSQEARSSTSGQALSSGNDSCTFQLYESLNCSNTDRPLWK